MRVWSSEKKPIRNREGPQEGEYWKPVVLTDIDIPFSRMVAISFTALLAMMVSGLLVYFALIIAMVVIIAAILR